jgi:sulfite reductase (ferredoxin)
MTLNRPADLMGKKRPKALSSQRAHSSPLLLHHLRRLGLAGYTRGAYVCRPQSSIAQRSSESEEVLATHKGRLKYVVEDWGIERVRAEIEARLGWKLATARPIRFSNGEMHLGWHQQNEPGCWYVGIFVENGRIKDTEGRPMLTGLREIVRRFRPAVRLTPSQDLILSGIPEEKVELVRGALKEYRIPTEKQVSNLRRHALACPALPTCGLAITEAERRLPYLLDALEGLGYGNEEIRLRMSGCPNSCSRPPTAEISTLLRLELYYA